MDVLGGFDERVTALVAPAQDNGLIRHVSDVRDLAQHKRFVLLGTILNSSLDTAASRDAASLFYAAEAAVIVVTQGYNHPMHVLYFPNPSQYPPPPLLSSQITNPVSSCTTYAPLMP